MTIQSAPNSAVPLRAAVPPNPALTPNSALPPHAGLAPAPAAVPAAAAAPAAAPALAPARAGATPVLCARRLQQVYGSGEAGTRALDGVDLDLARAESIAVMGPSGCGKTTLLHVLAGILRPTAGTVRLEGEDLAALPDRRRTLLRRSAFGFVFQDGQLLPELTALENVILPRMLGGVRRGVASSDARAWLDRLGIGALADRRPGQLSGGQAQRVAIARALAGRPSVVFADEPTGALDQGTGHAVLDVLVGACAESGASLVMVTHDPGVAAACERTVAMRDGRIEREFVRPAGGVR